MNLEKPLLELDNLVRQGKLIEAAQGYLDESVRTSGSNEESTSSKKEKLESLTNFLGNVKRIKKIKYSGFVIDQNTTYSKFKFVFQLNDFSIIKWKEIIQREWNENGKVISEKYIWENFKKLKKRIALKNTPIFDPSKEDNILHLPAEILDDLDFKEAVEPIPTISLQKQNKKIHKKKNKESVEKPPSRKKAEKPKTQAKNSQNAAPKKVKVSAPSEVKERVTKKAAPMAKKVRGRGRPRTKAPIKDIRLIEGVGPAVKKVLEKEKMGSFAAIAKSTPEKLLEILLKHGGPRARRHKTDTWPLQASLAVEGKWDELEELKKQLIRGVEA